MEKDNLVRTATAVGLASATIGLGALNGVIKPAEDVEGSFVTREEYNAYKESFQRVLDDLPRKADDHIVEVLDIKSKEGYLDTIRIWKTATQSTTSGKMRKKEE